MTHVGPIFPKKGHLGPQNDFGSSRPEKLPNIVNRATNKETKKLKEIMVGAKWNRRVVTNIHLDHSSPIRKQWSPLRLVPP